MNNPYEPTPEHHFTFGLWTVGNPGPRSVRHRGPRAARPGRDGAPSRRPRCLRRELPRQRPRALRLVADERDDILKRFRRALDETGMKVPMVTTNLFWRPVFKEGAFTANDPRGAPVRGQEGLRGDRARCRARRRRSSSCGVVARGWRPTRPRTSGWPSTATRRRSTSAASTSRPRDLGLRIALEPKPNEPRGDILLPTVGHALAFIGDARMAGDGRARTPSSPTRP